MERGAQDGRGADGMQYEQKDASNYGCAISLNILKLDLY